MNSNFIFYILAGIIISVGAFISQKKSKDDAMKDFIKGKGWKLISKKIDKTNFNWSINVRGKSEALYYIKYCDKEDKLHECTLFIDFDKNEFKIIKDIIVEKP